MPNSISRHRACVRGRRWLLCAAVLVPACDDGGSTRPPVDAIPPAAVQDLQIVSPAGRTISLAWTSSGDDGMVGQASRYEIRYSPRLLTGDNWDSAAVAPSPPPPKPPGQAERVDLSELPAGDWFFALRVADEKPNWSPLSNVVAGAVGDGTPPADVADLRVAGITAGDVTLAWTAPGDDGTTGTAAEYDLRYSAEPLFASNWSQASPVAGVPAPGPAGSEESFTVALGENQTWYLALVTADAAGNHSGLSNVIEAIVGDDTPPGPTADLRAVGGDRTGVTLSWTAPGDDGTEGTAAGYDLRWSLDPLAGENWDAATPVSGVPLPGPGGTEQTFRVNGLAERRTYYFALKTADEVPHWSPISNVAIGTTLPLTTTRLTVTWSGGFGATMPAWSPDGARIAFAADWEAATTYELYVVPASGGTAVRLTSDPGSLSDYAPAWSPDGASLAYVSNRGGKRELWIMPAEPGAAGRQVIRPEGSGPGVDSFSWSPDGSTLLFAVKTSASPPESQFWTVPAEGGAATLLLTHPSSTLSPAWSPDGTRIAFQSNRTGNQEIWVMAADGTDPMPLTDHPEWDLFPSWSADGSRLAFQSTRSGNAEIWSMAPDGTDLLLLTNDPATDSYPTWSPDGTRLAFSSARGGVGTEEDIWMVEL